MSFRSLMQSQLATDANRISRRSALAGLGLLAGTPALLGGAAALGSASAAAATRKGLKLNFSRTPSCALTGHITQ